MFALSASNFAHGLIVAVGSGVATAVYEMTNTMVAAHAFTFTGFDWHLVAGVAFASFVGYMNKKFFSNSDDKFVGKV